MTVVIKIKNHSKPKPSLEDVQGMAAALCKGSSHEKISSVLQAIAKEAFDPLAKGMAINTVQKRTGLQMKVIKSQLAMFEQELGMVSSDFSLEVARSIRRDHFDLAPEPGTRW